MIDFNRTNFTNLADFANLARTKNLASIHHLSSTHHPTAATAATTFDVFFLAGFLFLFLGQWTTKNMFFAQS